MGRESQTSACVKIFGNNYHQNLIGAVRAVSEERILRDYGDKMSTCAKNKCFPRDNCLSAYAGIGLVRLAFENSSAAVFLFGVVFCFVDAEQHRALKVTINV